MSIKSLLKNTVYFLLMLFFYISCSVNNPFNSIQITEPKKPIPSIPSNVSASDGTYIDKVVIMINDN